MPANLSPDFLEAEKEYKSAKTPDEKFHWLQKMLSSIPKHKGTEKMQADLKKKIAQFKEQQENQTKKKVASHRVKPEGAGQITLVGPPNSGKSSLLKAMTNAEPEIAAYPFTTREPIPGMMRYHDIHIQLVDLPPIAAEHCDNFVFDNIRGCDGILFIIDMEAEDPAKDFAFVRDTLKEKHIVLIPPDAEFPEENGLESVLRAILLLNKCDLDTDSELETLIREMLQTDLLLLPVSAFTGFGLDAIADTIFRLLHIVRIYSKEPGKEPDMVAPFTAPIGVTVEEFARIIHKDLFEHMKSARVWGSAKFDGQVVHRDHILKDKDIVEISV